MYCMLTFQHSSDVFTFITTYIMDHEIWYCLMFQHRSIMLSASLLTTLILALSIAALPIEVRNSLITLPIARRLNTANGTINISQHDQARVDAGCFASPLDRRAFAKPIIN